MPSPKLTGSLVSLITLLGCADDGSRADEVGEAEAESAESESKGESGEADTSSSDSSDASESDASESDASESDSTGDGDPDPACPNGTIEPETSALSFDGVDDHVSMGVAPQLGLQQFTVEAWVRREGGGQTAGTGVGGLQLVPIAGKGRGENDGSNVDCNYAFGFAGAVLGADFEDANNGSNHPVVGTIPIPYGEWHHVAVTYDGSAWSLYVDGQLDVSEVENATPRSDSIQHFAIATAMDSSGTPEGRLHGAVDELRVWNFARSQAELQATMYQTLANGNGLVGRWALDSADAGVPDSVGNNDGTLVGASFVEPGALLDLGTPPSVTSPSPAAGASVPAGDVELGVAISDAEDSDFVVTFHVREVMVGEDFTVVVLPDTQYYTVQGNDYEDNFYAQTQWIMDNLDAYDIVATIHNGDLVEHGDDFDYEWMVADTAISTLEAASAMLPDGLPFGITVGNHDQEPIGNAGGTTKWNQYFGIDRFAGRAYYGGHYGDRNDEHWFTFSAGGLDFVVVSLQYDTTPDPAVLQWARGIFEAHPDAFGILNSHYLVGTGNPASFGAQGQATYNALRDVDNLQLMTCGHIAGEGRRADSYLGNTIHTMLADYQGRANGGDGWLRVWEFSPANDELTVRTYSPVLDQWEMDADSEFTLSVDLAGATMSFQELATLDPATDLATASWPDLASGKTYEWYVTVSDCVHTVASPVFSFSTL